MQALREGYDGLSLVMALNLDRFVFLATIILALLAGSWLAGL